MDLGEESFSTDDWRAIGQAIARLRASVMAVTFGIAGGFGLFVATAWLLVHGAITGARNIGQTLNLLSNYFPGYSVTWVGAVVGLFYGALLGAVMGYVLAVVYNNASKALRGKDSRQ
jgi:hypothetical protein